MTEARRCDYGHDSCSRCGLMMHIDEGVTEGLETRLCDDCARLRCSRCGVLLSANEGWRRSCDGAVCCDACLGIGEYTQGDAEEDAMDRRREEGL